VVKSLYLTIAAGAVLVVMSGAATAGPLKIEAVMSPKEQIRFEFEDESKHFVLFVRREGKADGQGALAGASVSEYGMHDIVPGKGGDPRGYLVFADSSGDKAYVKWQVLAVFVPTPDGKQTLLDNGFWELAGGTGKFKGMKGAGTLHIKAVSPTDRRFILDGTLAP